MHQVSQSLDSVVIKETVIRINRSVHNCLVFCMSHLETAESKPFKSYDDHWAFPEAKAPEFAGRLGNLIFQQANLDFFDNALSSEHTPRTIQSLALSLRHRKVVYRDRHMRITKNNMPSYEELLQVLSDVVFIKPERFSEENEYRFVYELNDGKSVFQPKKENLLLTLNPFADL